MTEIELKEEITKLLNSYEVKEENLEYLFSLLKNKFDSYHRKKTRFR